MPVSLPPCPTAVPSPSSVSLYTAAALHHTLGSLTAPLFPSFVRFLTSKILYLLVILLLEFVIYFPCWSVGSPKVRISDHLREGKYQFRPESVVLTVSVETVLLTEEVCTL